MVYSSTIFDPILNPLLINLGPFWSLLIVTIFVSLLTTIIYKYATNQTEMRSLKESMNRYKKKISKVKKDPDKSLKLQSEMMKVNGQYMKHSFKSMIFTIVPLMLFLGWLSAHLAFQPILPAEEFNVTVTFEDNVTGSVSLILPDDVSASGALEKNITDSRAVFSSLSAPQGSYDIGISASDSEEFFPVLVSTNNLYAPPLTEFEDSSVFASARVGLDKLYVFQAVPVLGSLPLIKKAGWLTSYILLSILFTSLLRKWMGVV